MLSFAFAFASSMHYDPELDASLTRVYARHSQSTVRVFDADARLVHAFDAVHAFDIEEVFDIEDTFDTEDVFDNKRELKSSIRKCVR